MIVRRAWPLARMHLGRTVLAGLLVAGLGGASATFSDEAPSEAPQIVATGFEKPTGLVVHPQGFLLLTDRKTGRLYRLTPRFTTAGEPAFSRKVLFAGLDEPIGVAVEPDEDLLVAEKDEGLVRFRGEKVFSAVRGLKDPRWLAVDGDGSIFVSTAGIKKEKLAKRMPKPKGDVLLKIAPDGAFSVIADGFKELSGLALDHAGHLFAGAERRRGDEEKHGGTIFKIRLPDGEVSPVIAGGFEGPRDLEFDGLGALFFTATEIREERESDEEDDEDRAGTQSSGNREAEGRDKDDREDEDKGVILKATFKDHGTLDQLTLFADGLGKPEGLAFDLDGNLYIAEGKHGRVLRFQAPEAPVLAPPLPVFTDQQTLTVRGTAEPNTLITVMGGAAASTGLAAAPSGAFAVGVSLTPNREQMLRVFATGARGDGLTSPATKATVTHDDIRPDTLITGGPSGTINTTTATFTFTATEAGSTFQCQLDGDAFAACTSPKSYTGLTPGLHTFRVKARDQAGNEDPTPAERSFTPDTTAPAVSFTVPANAATGVAINQKIAATFSEAMDPSTITPVTFTLKQGTTAVAGTVSYAGVTATFTPASALAPLTTYTATVTTGARDLAGNALASNFVWSFTTGATPDTTAPTVSFTVPANAATGVAISQKIAATFSEAMDPLAITTGTFTLQQGTTAVAGTVSYAGVTATFNPLSPLAPNTPYTATMTTGASDLAGNALASAFVWSFTTGMTPDTTRPIVSVTVPANAATGVAINQKIAAAFSEAMDPLTITTVTFTLKQGTTAVAGTVSYAGVTATFNPASTLAPNSTFTATMTTGARDLAGTALATDFSWSFTTGTTSNTTPPTVTFPWPPVTVSFPGVTAAFAPAFGLAIPADTIAATAAGPAPVALGAASTFAVLAGSTVTSTGATTVDGSLGLSPGTAVTGFPPGTVNGTIHAGNPAAAQAQSDLTTAYNDAAGRTVGAILVAGNLGGQTLTPGLYTSTSSLAISSGDLTLDAQGDANAVFIFQMASTLTTTVGRRVILSGGAKAANVFWQVGSSATLGTGSVFKGNILALASITVTTGAAVEGRLLARTGAVTLDSNIIIIAPASAEVCANAGTGVSISGNVAVAFSEAMDPLTITTETFTLKQGTTAVAGTVSYAGVTATFNPASNLVPLTLYTAMVTTGARNLAGTALAASFCWSFTTGVTPDTTRPIVSATVPANAATAVAINQAINAAFSEAMDPLTITPVTFTLKQGSTAVAGTVTYAGVTATFTPASALAPLTIYTAVVNTGAKDLAGNALATDFGWSFTTGATPDTTRPAVSATVPANGATAVPINQTINATFSEAMDPLTVSTASLRVTGPGGTAVTGTVGYDVPSKIATFTPVSTLAPNTTYTATMTAGARDLAGNALAVNVVWSFTTAATPAGQAPVALGAASTFAVLAGSTVTNTGPTTVNGDLGLSPGTAVTGFPPGTVNGTIHAADPAAAQAQLDLTTAYNDAAGRTVDAILVAGNLGGQTLTPGLYTSTSSLEISSGDLTLDAQGDANAVFIFQMASTLTTTVGRQVILSGGAKAANVFWQVGSSATLGTGSVFKGNILALASITVTTGAVVEGRLLARTAAVTLDSNIIGLAIPADTTTPTVSFIVPANAATDVSISGNVAATFSEAMDPLTITTGTFTLQQGTTAVAGTVSYAGVTATFNPLSTLAPNTTYTATVTTGARDLAGNALAADFSWSFTTGATPDTTAPAVSFIVPANAATGVSISGNVAATFSEAMNPLTITTGTFTLQQGTTAVAGTLSYAGVTATFTPASALAPLTTFTATVTTGASDLAGNALATDFSWSFTTGATPDTTRPTVSATVPANAATDVSISGNVAAAFSEAMDPLTITTGTFTLKQGTTAVAGTVSYAGVTATFNPLSTLAPNTTYTATVTTGARDLAGNALAADFSWSLTTGATPDTTPPTVSATVPANGATAVPINQTINATFSEAMDPLTITTASLRVTGPGGTAVTGTVAYDVPSQIATLNPVSNLAPNTTYTATMTIGTRDLAGNALAVNVVWSFTTAATAAGQAPVALGAASTFAVLAGSTVTNTGPTTVNGDLGLSPGTAVTGFPPGRVNGTIRAADPAARLAQLDLTTAYDNATGRTADAIEVAGNLGGQTLTPGLYTSTSSLEISSGDLTLDAQGDANAVFIFQMASTLTTTVGRQVILSGGAKAANVFWQVGSSATLGTGSVFKGNILALASITVTTGAAVEGRLLARTAAVTLDSNIIGLAIPADTTTPTVRATVPANAATGVSISGNVAATFSEAMNPLTITTGTFTLKQGTTAVAGTVSYAGVTATFNPLSTLAPNATYTATVTIGARDLAGNALAANVVWSFTTAAAPTGQAPVALGAASTFAVLAGSTVTNTGPTTVNGNLGLSPGTAVTGFPPGRVNGTIHAGNPAAAQAQLDLTTAYNNAAGRTVGAILVAGNLGGRTLTPGLYTSTSSLAISSGDLTLDAQGNANAVFIFQMGSTLTTTVGRQVILSGGARAANVFWQVGSSATLGTGSVFRGTILALASITVTTGAAVEGRLLARTAAVTLDSNIIGLAIPADTTALTVGATVAQE